MLDEQLNPVGSATAIVYEDDPSQPDFKSGFQLQRDMLSLAGIGPSEKKMIDGIQFIQTFKYIGNNEFEYITEVYDI